MEEMKTPYLAAIEKKWERMKKFYEENVFKMLLPTTVANDTSFHMAVYSGKKKPLHDLLELAEGSPMMSMPAFRQNIYKNTILHEAAATRNLEAVKLLICSCGDDGERHDLLLNKNIYDETPLFTAAAYGSTKVVRYLASLEGERDNDGKLIEAHRKRAKFQKESILHVAILGEQFGTALELLKLDESLAEVKDKKGRTSLQLLSTRASAFRSGCKMDMLKRLIYFCIPVGEDHDDDYEVIENNDGGRIIACNCQGRSRDLESGLCVCTMRMSKIRCILDLNRDSVKRLFMRFIFAGWPMIKNVWEVKRKHKFARALAEKLIKKDNSWQQSEMKESSVFGEDRSQSQSPPATEDKHGQKDSETKVEIPLLLATRYGILEIFNHILDLHPQAVEHMSHLNQNILHVAIMCRRKKVFDRVKKMAMPMNRLVRAIDTNGYTILHHAADVEHADLETFPGPAYQLQDELAWFRRVDKITPNYYAAYYADVEIERKKDKKETHQMTARQLFKEKHKKQLKEAQTWIKETSQSCSAVAVLVATVVFAAAFTVPGGSNDEGLPIFLKSALFLVFTVMDIVSLASSLTAVVMFLSILTSPFQFEDFEYSLPQKLTFGFALLFFSVATTMLAFTATVLLIIRLEPRRWTSTLVYTAAFLPVSILALTQFPMFVSFIKTLVGAFKILKRVFPLNLVVKLCTKMINTIKAPHHRD